MTDTEFLLQQLISSHDSFLLSVTLDKDLSCQIFLYKNLNKNLLASPDQNNNTREENINASDIDENNNNQQ